ncbi:MAG: serine/threonine protein kinase [Planctomycetes bacterium]|nr:serine/threonine protein kinase [Planctomycetota bacterium]
MSDPASAGRSPELTPGALTRALLAAGVDRSRVQAGYDRASTTGLGYREALLAVGVDCDLYLGSTPGAGEGALPARLEDYEIGRKLGAGGMAAVYAARHLPTGSERALKLLRADAGDELVERFQREAEGMAAAARHPHVVGIHAAGRSGVWLWIAMDLVEGGSLADRLTEGPLSIEDARRVTLGLARGLAHAHAVGVLHRDLKPDNVLLDEQGEALLVDFGLARLTWQHSLTQTGVLLGTPAYMAPEQAHGESVDERADVYALGGILYHCLTGEAPYAAPTLLGLLDQVLNSPVPRARSLRAEVPAELDALCAAALAKDAADRPPSAEVFAAALEGQAQFTPPTRAGWRSLVGALLAVAALGGGLWVTAVLEPSDRAAKPADSGPAPFEEITRRVFAADDSGGAQDLDLLRSHLANMSRLDTRRGEVELAIGLLRLELERKGPSRLPSLNSEAQGFLRAVEDLQVRGRVQGGSLERLSAQAESLGLSGWVPRWTVRSEVLRATSLIVGARGGKALEALEHLSGARPGASAFGEAELAQAQRALASRPDLLAGLERTLDVAALAALDEVIAWCDQAGKSGTGRDAPTSLLVMGSLAWRVQCLKGAPIELSLFAARLSDPDAMEATLAFPGEKQRPLHHGLLAPKDRSLALVSGGFEGAVALAFTAAPADRPLHTARISALWADQLCYCDPERLIEVSPVILARISLERPIERSSVHETTAAAHVRLATKGTPGWGPHLERAREHLELALGPGGLTNAFHVNYQQGLVALMQRDATGAYRGFSSFHRWTVLQGGQDVWQGRRLHALNDCATLLALTAPKSRRFNGRAALAKEAARRFMALPQTSRSKGWHDGTFVLMAGLVRFLGRDPQAKKTLSGALTDWETDRLARFEIENLIATSPRPSPKVAWDLLRRLLNHHETEVYPE